MDLTSVALQLMPVWAIVAVYALTSGAKQLVYTPEGAPKWFLFIPICLGLAFGLMAYFASTADEALVLLPLWRKIINSLISGLGSAGISVLAWEGKCRFWPDKKEDVTS